MRQRGGTIVGRGNGAIIVAPPIPCKGELTPRQGFVSRIQQGELYGATPPAVLERLRAIDPDQQYFYYPVECTPGTLTAENRRDGITDETKETAELIRYAPGGSMGTPSRMNRTTAAQRAYLKRAVTLLHANGIVHNDLHPANVVLAEDGLPRIIDWQSATLHSATDVNPKVQQAKRDDWESLGMTMRGGKRKTRRRTRRLTRTSASGRA